MSLCGPAAASGSTACPPGEKKHSPKSMERPMREKEEYTSLTEDVILRRLSAGANDRCTKADEETCIHRFNKITAEDGLNHVKEMSPIIDWREPHGTDYNDNKNLWSANDDAVSLGSQGDELGDDFVDNTSDSKAIDKRQGDDCLELLAPEHRDNQSLPTSTALRFDPRQSANGDSEGKTKGIKQLFVNLLIGHGSFGWPPLLLHKKSTSQSSKNETTERQHQMIPRTQNKLHSESKFGPRWDEKQRDERQESVTGEGTDDCCKRKPLQEVRRMLATPCTEATDEKASHAMRRWRKAISKSCTTHANTKKEFIPSSKNVNPANMENADKQLNNNNVRQTSARQFDQEPDLLAGGHNQDQVHTLTTKSKNNKNTYKHTYQNVATWQGTAIDGLNSLERSTGAVNTPKSKKADNKQDLLRDTMVLSAATTVIGSNDSSGSMSTQGGPQGQLCLELTKVSNGRVYELMKIKPGMTKIKTTLMETSETQWMSSNIATTNETPMRLVSQRIETPSVMSTTMTSKISTTMRQPEHRNNPMQWQHQTKTDRKIRNKQNSERSKQWNRCECGRLHRLGQELCECRVERSRLTSKRMTTKEKRKVPPTMTSAPAQRRELTDVKKYHTENANTTFLTEGTLSPTKETSRGKMNMLASRSLAAMTSQTTNKRTKSKAPVLKMTTFTAKSNLVGELNQAETALQSSKQKRITDEKANVSLSFTTATDGPQLHDGTQRNGHRADDINFGSVVTNSEDTDAVLTTTKILKPHGANRNPCTRFAEEKSTTTLALTSKNHEALPALRTLMITEACTTAPELPMLTRSMAKPEKEKPLRMPMRATNEANKTTKRLLALVPTTTTTTITSRWTRNNRVLMPDQSERMKPLTGTSPPNKTMNEMLSVAKKVPRFFPSRYLRKMKARVSTLIKIIKGKVQGLSFQMVPTAKPYETTMPEMVLSLYHKTTKAGLSIPESSTKHTTTTRKHRSRRMTKHNKKKNFFRVQHKQHTRTTICELTKTIFLSSSDPTGWIILSTSGRKMRTRCVCGSRVWSTWSTRSYLYLKGIRPYGIPRYKLRARDQQWPHTRE